LLNITDGEVTSYDIKGFMQMEGRRSRDKEINVEYEDGEVLINQKIFF
jgi:hypothetical protein